MSEKSTGITLRDKAGHLQKLLDERMVQIARALPPGTMSADRFARVVLTLCQKTPKLMECRPATLLGAVMSAAQLGLSPDPVIGEAWFVPFRDIVQFVPGYRGLIKLAWQSDAIAKIAARTVRVGDVFKFEYGLDERLVHEPRAELSAELSHVYAVAKIKGGESQFVVMTREEVERIKSRSPSARSGVSPWHTDYDEMAKKTVLRRLCKTLPTSTSPPLQKALALDELAEHGLKQHVEGIFADGNEKETESGTEDVDDPGLSDERSAGQSGGAREGKGLEPKPSGQKGG